MQWYLSYGRGVSLITAKLWVTCVPHGCRQKPVVSVYLTMLDTYRGINGLEVLRVKYEHSRKIGHQNLVCHENSTFVY